MKSLRIALAGALVASLALSVAGCATTGQSGVGSTLSQMTPQQKLDAACAVEASAYAKFQIWSESHPVKATIADPVTAAHQSARDGCANPQSDPVAIALQVTDAAFNIGLAYDAARRAKKQT